MLRLEKNRVIDIEEEEEVEQEEEEEESMTGNSDISFDEQEDHQTPESNPISDGIKAHILEGIGLTGQELEIYEALAEGKEGIEYLPDTDRNEKETLSPIKVESLGGNYEADPDLEKINVIPTIHRVSGPTPAPSRPIAMKPFDIEDQPNEAI